MRNTETCSSCSRVLVDSIYAILDGRLHKSCALCSRVLGEHVFHPMKAFGVWHSPTSEERRPYPQSECMAATQARIVAKTTSLSGVAYSQLAGLLPKLPADGSSCSTVHPVTAEDGEVAAMLEVLRSEAEADLEAREPRQLMSRGRQYGRTIQSGPQTITSGRVSYTNVRSLPPRTISSTSESGAEIQTHAKHATVLRRRAGVVTPAQIGAV